MGNLWAHTATVGCIVLRDLCRGFNTRRYNLVHGFYFLKLFPIECIVLIYSLMQALLFP